MAKKTTVTTRRQAAKAEEPKHCKDCRHSYDPHELDYKGEPFMCRCRVNTKRCRFLTRDACGQYERKV